MKGDPSMQRLAFALLVGVVSVTGCRDSEDGAVEQEPEAVVLGPADGRDLPGVDLERVQVGDVAPDFTLVSLAGPPVTLSDFRSLRNVVLVFYRGHW
jgi:hypothetical protein